MYVLVRSTDISQSGIRLQTEKPVPLRTLVHLGCEELHLAGGSAVVRHCSQKGMKYEIGLEFVGGIEWRAPGAG